MSRSDFEYLGFKKALNKKLVKILEKDPNMKKEKIKTPLEFFNAYLASYIEEKSHLLPNSKMIQVCPTCGHESKLK